MNKKVIGCGKEQNVDYRLQCTVLNIKYSEYHRCSVTDSYLEKCNTKYD
jgi:hypothetical protein